jgi:hypothetical protein
MKLQMWSNYSWCPMYQQFSKKMPQWEWFGNYFREGGMRMIWELLWGGRSKSLCPCLKCRGKIMGSRRTIFWHFWDDKRINSTYTWVPNPRIQENYRSLLVDCAQEESDLTEDSFEEFSDEEDWQLKEFPSENFIQIKLIEFQSILDFLIPKVLWWFQAQYASKHPFLNQAIHFIFLNFFLESNCRII